MRMALSYLQYRINAKNRHGVHSPFVYKLNEDVIGNTHYPSKDAIENLRAELESNNQVIDINDLGAGSRTNKSNSRKVSEIARVSSGSQKDLALLYNLLDWLKGENVLELGTNLGLSAAVMASVPSVKRLISIEGDEQLKQIAVKNLENLGLNAEIIQGAFEDRLDLALDKLQHIDFAYIDGNHQLEPTLHYFNRILDYTHSNSVICIGDIHWSKEMEEAWETIKEHESVKVTVDVFSIGLVFFKTELSKEHFILHG